MVLLIMGSLIEIRKQIVVYQNLRIICIVIMVHLVMLISAQNTFVQMVIQGVNIESIVQIVVVGVVQ